MFEPREPLKVIKRPSSMAWDEGDGIARGVMFARHVKLTHCKELWEALEDIRDGRRMPLVFDNSRVLSASFEAREWGASPEVIQSTSAVAFLVGGPISRVIASFFLRFNRPQYSARVFSDEDAAVTWARSYVPTSNANTA